MAPTSPQLNTAGVQQAANSHLYVSPAVTPPKPFDGAPDAEALHKAMKGFGTDDKTLSTIIATRTRDQLVQIATVFQAKFGKTLESFIKGDTSGGYQDLLVALITPKADYDARLLHNAVAGVGTDDDQLIEVLCTRNNQELRDMKAAYTRLYHKEADKDVSGDTSFNYKELLMSVLRADRPESTTVNIDEVKKDAMYLYQQGEGRAGTNEKAFIDILTHRSFPHLHLLGQQYANIAGHSLESGIAKETSGGFKKAMITLITPRDEYFADSVHKAIAGAGTDDHKMIRAISYITNTKEMTQAVNNIYVHKYKHNLANDIGGDTAGWYKKTAQLCIQTRTAL
jgi:annexin A7/11